MNIKRRLYNDFFRPSKEGEYERILKAARDNGYEFHTVLSFEDVVGGPRYYVRCWPWKRNMERGLHIIFDGIPSAWS